MTSVARVAEEELEFDRDQTCLHNGRPFTGIAVEKFRGGAIRSEVAYVDGMQTGFSRDWYPNGQLRSESEFHENSLHGNSRKWYENGALEEDSNHELGIELRRSLWAEDGTLLEQRSLAESDFRYRLLSKWRKTNSDK